MNKINPDAEVKMDAILSTKDYNSANSNHEHLEHKDFNDEP